MTGFRRLKLDLVGPMVPLTLSVLASDWATELERVHAVGKLLGPLLVSALMVDEEGTRGAIDPDPQGGSPDQALAYLAPEYSRRLAKPADHRADIYALGVVLYELATGARPFFAPDPGAILHRHLTLVPPEAISLAPALPKTLSDLIARMMAKDPAARPQSAAEVRQALAGRSAARLNLPDLVYGQQEPLSRALAQLKAALAGQAARLICIKGPSGAGKSTLIAGLARSGLPPGARLVQGKFDQLDRTQPYSAFLTAFEAMLRHILAGTRDEVDIWRQRLLEALSPSAQVILDILPRFQALIGPQPPVPALGLNEAQIRVTLVLRRFLAALARPEAPLVIFLDDLQWADAASLTLIRLILSDSGPKDLVLLTAYRDNELGPDHPVQIMLDEVAGLQTPIALHPLQGLDVARLVADCLGTPVPEAEPLAAIIARKTAGNPYFIRQFLLALARAGRIFHDPAQGGWRWDADGALAESFTENVLDLVADRIAALPEPVQELLRIGSCMGGQCDVELMARLVGHDPDAVADHLQQAVEADILRVSERRADLRALRFQFLHDRAQQAANAALDEDQRCRIHARLGAILLATSGEDEAQLTQITDHLINGFDHLPAELRQKLRDLALASAARSMATNAYQAAQRYFLAAAGTLPGDPWQADPALAFRVDLECSKIAYLLGHIPEAEARVKALLTRELATLDRVAVLEVLILIHNSEVRYLQALEAGFQALDLLGAPLPKAPGLLRVMGSLVLTKIVNRRFSDHDIAYLPNLTDPRLLAVMRVLVLLCPPAYFASSTLLPLITLRIVRLSLRHGNAPASAYAYSIYGMLHALVLRNPQRANELAEMSILLIPKLGAESHAGRIAMMYGGFIRHWSAPLKASLDIFAEGIEPSLLGGDVETHGYLRYGHGSYALMAGLPLVEVTAEMEKHLAAVTVVRHEKTRRIMSMALNSIYRMQGRTWSEPFDEDENIALWTRGADATSLSYWHKYKLLEALMQADYAEVLVQAQGIKANERGILSMAYDPYYKFYQALAQIHLSRGMALPGRQRWQARAARVLRQLQGLARHAPATHQHRAVLLEAEFAASRGKTAKAVTLFDTAVAVARKAGSLHDTALGLERAGLFYLGLGAHDQARVLLQQAVEAFHLWGGSAWAEALAFRHPDLGLIAQPTGPPQVRVDGETLIRAASTLAGTSSPAEMVDEMLRVMLESAGATRGVLLLTEDGVLSPVAHRPADSDPGWPEGLVQVVQRTGQVLVLNDARADPEFSRDPVLQRLQVQSVMGVPLLAKGAVIGIAYLENAHLRGAFSPDRARLVELLGAQTAIAMENTRLLQSLQSLLERQVDMTSAHARFVPHTFLQMLDRPSILDVRLGDHVRANSSILFADIRGFTPLIEAMPPEEVMDFVNGFLSRMEPAVRDNAGFIDNIIGDAVMAVFDKGAEAGVLAGIAMLRALADWQSRIGSAVQIGIGVATGELIFGTIGAANRLKCGVMGDTVNLAARIEGLTRHYGLGFLITDATHDALPDKTRFAMREVDLVEVVGRQTPVRIHEVFDADPEGLRLQKAQGAADLAEGLALYRAQDLLAARVAFKRAAATAPDDPVARLQLRRCDEAMSWVSQGAWTGIARMREK